MEEITCKECNGTGSIFNGTGAEPVICPVCLGSGMMYRFYAQIPDKTSTGYVKVGELIIK